MLKVAIIGCGRIADDHLHQIKRIADCEVVATCDVEPLMARQLADRYQIAASFSDVVEMLERIKPDVVHITTPPQSHFALAKQCLQARCHVYVEKPFTVTTSDAERLVELAEQNSVKITVGHDLQFSPSARRMRELIHSGYLGGGPVHMESYYCYDFGNAAYAKGLLSNGSHWVRQLPGGLLQNVISHGIARLAEFLCDGHIDMSVHSFISPALRQLGENDMCDELRVMIASEESTTAYFVFSSQMRPALNLFRVYGRQNGLVLDQNMETLTQLPGKRFKSYADKFIPPVLLAGQQFRNVGSNLRKFIASDFHMKSGMKYLIESFYQAISTKSAPPIRYDQILRTSRLMDGIFSQLQLAGTSVSETRLRSEI